MTNAARTPTHRLIRYDDKGKNAPRAEVGAIWTNEDGSLSIRLDTLERQFWFSGFPIEEDRR